jgi:Methyltransferase domain
VVDNIHADRVPGSSSENSTVATSGLLEPSARLVGQAVRRLVINWPTLYASIFLRKLGLNSIPARDCRTISPERILPHVTPREAAFVAGGLFVASQLKLPEGAAEATLDMLTISRSVVLELQSRYSPHEIKNGITGGWPGFKEILLYCLIRRTRPQDLLETGVAQGVSSRFILEALKRNGSGNLISVDLPAFEGTHQNSGEQDPTMLRRGLEPGWIVPTSLRRSWTLKLGPAEAVLPNLDVRLDLFCHDSRHTYEHMRFEGDWAVGHLRRNGILVMDDITWNSAFSDLARSLGDRGTLLCSKQVGVIELQ